MLSWIYFLSQGHVAGNFVKAVNSLRFSVDCVEYFCRKPRSHMLLLKVLCKGIIDMDWIQKRFSKKEIMQNNRRKK